MIQYKVGHHPTWMGQIFPRQKLRRSALTLIKWRFEEMQDISLIHWSPANLKHQNWISVGLGITISAAAIYFSSKMFFPKKTDEDKDIIRVKVMTHETTIMAMMPAVATVTRYALNDGNMPIAFLKRRIADIMFKNPWLTGRLVSNSNLGLHIAYKDLADIEAASQLLEEYFLVLNDYELDENIAFPDLVKQLSPLSLKKGSECVNKPKEKLFQVIAIKIKGRDEMVLLVSVSHTLGDGYTYYSIYSMLDAHTPVTAMQVQRHSDYDNQMANLIGKKAVDFFNSPWVLMGLLGCALFRSRMNIIIVEVDPAWIEKQKALVRSASVSGSETSVSFLSTNDVLTAWSYRISRTDIALMTINARKRVPTFTTDMAGNYENSILYNTPEDCHTAVAIRKSLSTFRSKSGSLPSVYKTLQWNCGLTTNWSSFYKQIDISDPADASVQCTHLNHFPIVEGNDLAVFREGVCMFKLDANRTGLLIATRFITPAMLEAEGIGKITPCL